MAATAVTWPNQSKGTTRLGDGAVRRNAQNAKAPAGMLMKKFRRQSSIVRRPPIIGPEIEAMEPPSAQTATARARCLASGYAWLIRVREAGMMTAAAAPWM